MFAETLISALRALTWCCVCLLALLSLMPAQQMIRTGIPGELEHFLAYAGSALVATAAYGQRRSPMAIMSLFWGYAGLLEWLQHFSPGRHPAIADFAASAAGALCGTLAMMLVMGRSGKADRDTA
jgi:VanZ family protein